MKGNCRAMTDLGFIYSEGAEKDLHIALRLAEKAASNSNIPKSQRLAGSLNIIKNNLGLAKKWFEKAAEGGDVDGM